MRISPVTIDCVLRKDKTALSLKGKSLTKSAGILKHRIPIRTFYTSQERKLPGFIQIDTVHHCGQAASGQYILTLTVAASGWICLYSLLNKAHRWTFAALRDIYANLPFPCGSSTAITAASSSTRSSPTGTATPPALFPLPAQEATRKMTTVCGPLVRVEQKNGAVVRDYIGYDHLEGDTLQSRLARVYRHLVPLLNFFMPAMKLESKVKVGSKEVKKYDAPRSPYQRLLESEALPPGVKAELVRQYGLYNPVQLQHNVNKAILALREAVAAQSSSSGREPVA
jgi:hypothetical protein